MAQGGVFTQMAAGTPDMTYCPMFYNNTPWAPDGRCGNPDLTNFCSKSRNYYNRFGFTPANQVLGRVNPFSDIYTNEVGGGFPWLPDDLPKVDNTLAVSRFGKRRKRRKRRRGGIRINPKNKGVFTRKARKAGKTVQQYATYVIRKYKGKTKTKAQLKLLRQAVFAKNAKKWGRRKKKKSRFGSQFPKNRVAATQKFNYELMQDITRTATPSAKNLSSIQGQTAVYPFSTAAAYKQTSNLRGYGYYPKDQ